VQVHRDAPCRSFPTPDTGSRSRTGSVGPCLAPVALIGLFDRLVDAGSSVIVIGHNLDVIARADWVKDLGPGAGQEGGGCVMFLGMPENLAKASASLTDRHLAARG